MTTPPRTPPATPAITTPATPPSRSTTARRAGDDARGCVAVVVISFNTRDLLAACLRSVERESAAHRLECVVVDNGSTDGSAAMVRASFPSVRLIVNPTNLGFAAATNQAVARAAPSEFVLLLNSDATLCERALAAAVGYADAHPEAAVIGCRQIDANGDPQQSGLRCPNLRGVVLAAAGLPVLFPNSQMLNWDRYGRARWPDPHDVEFVMGSLLLTRRAVFEASGGLDTRYFLYGEEADFCERVRRDGGRVILLPTVGLRHANGASSRGARLAAWVYEAKQRGILIFLHRWRGAGCAWLANLCMLLGLLPRAVGWGALDLVQAARLPGAERFARSRKLRIAGYHVRALWRPRLLARTVAPPPNRACTAARGHRVTTTEGEVNQR